MADHDKPEDSEGEDIHPLAHALFGWIEWRWTRALFFWGLGLLALGLVGAELLIDRHDYFQSAEATGFYALYGFIAFAFVVLTGWPLGRLLRRDENYYGDEDETGEEEPR